MAAAEVMASMRRVLAPTDWLDGDLEEADLRGGRDVRAAAELAAEVVDLEHAHELAVLLLEERESADLGGVLAGGHERAHRVVLDDAPVDEVLDLAQLLRRSAPRARRSRSAGARDGPCDPPCRTCSPSTMRRALCSRCVAVWLQAVWCRRTALTMALARSPSTTLPSTRTRHDDLVVDELHDALDLELAGVGVDPAGVGDLPAALGVERRLRQLDGDTAVAELAERADDGEDLEALVADEVDGDAGRAALEVLDLARAGGERALLLGGAGALALLVHEVPEALLVHGHVLLRGDLAREVEREAVGVVQLEGDLGGQLRAGVAGAAQRLLEDAHALVERAPEAHLLLVHDAPDLGLRRRPARVGRASSARSTASVSVARNGFSTPMATACCTARRMMRRST